MLMTSAARGGGVQVAAGLTVAAFLTLAVIARLFRVPVRWTETRVEHMTSTTHGRAQVTDLEAAVEADGTITAVRMHVIADIGAYPIFTFIPDLTLFMGVGVYKVTNVDLKSTCVFTNSTPVAAYRGAGRPEAAYYLERLVDVVAQELGKPPEEIRRKNFIPPSAFPYATPTGQKYDSGEYDRALGKALDLAGYQKLRAEQKDRISGGYKKLLSYQKAEIVYDATVHFCDRFIDKRSRTHDQMIQAANRDSLLNLDGVESRRCNGVGSSILDLLLGERHVIVV